MIDALCSCDIEQMKTMKNFSQLSLGVCRLPKFGNGRLTGNPTRKRRGIPWETLDETSQITSDFFHIKVKEVIKWELFIVIQIK